VLLVIAFFFDKRPARTAFAPGVEQRSLLSHDASVTGCIVAKAGGVTQQKAFRIGEEGLESIGIFSAVVPRENSAMRDSGYRMAFVEKEMAEVGRVAHPLIGNSTGKLFVQPVFKV